MPHDRLATNLSAADDRIRLSGWLDPCMPAHWPSFRVHYRYRETTYHITVLRETDAGAVPSHTIDGALRPVRAGYWCWSTTATSMSSSCACQPRPSRQRWRRRTPLTLNATILASAHSIFSDSVGSAAGAR